MRHTFYAEVPTQAHLDDAMNELETLQPETHRSSVLVHHNPVSSEEAELEETGARKGAFIGALIGGLGGFAIALLATALMALPAAYWLVLLLTSVGTLLGGLYCGISGSGSPDPALERLIEEAKRHAHFIVTVVSPDEAAQSTAEDVLQRHGARIQYR